MPALIIFMGIAAVAWCFAELADFLVGYIDRYAKARPPARNRGRRD